MTIKEFAKLCGCNPQTLRYYDRVGLLKPVRVDRYSGYRFYDEEQAVTFVKIKNLQSALFTIDEIKPLLDADSATVYKSFDEKKQLGCNVTASKDGMNHFYLLKRTKERKERQQKRPAPEMRNRACFCFTLCRYWY